MYGISIYACSYFLSTCLQRLFFDPLFEDSLNVCCTFFIPSHLQAWARLEQLAMADVVARPSASEQKGGTATPHNKDSVGCVVLYRVVLFDWLMM